MPKRKLPKAKKLERDDLVFYATGEKAREPTDPSPEGLVAMFERFWHEDKLASQSRRVRSS
jgi:hypothetical protein